LDSSAHRRVDAVCNRFEEAWKVGERPQLEEYLKDAAGPERSALLLELLIIELLYRRRKERLTSAEFKKRFPEDFPVIRKAFEAVASSGGSASRVSGRQVPAADTGVDSQQTGPDLDAQKSAKPPPAPSTIGRKLPSIPGFRILRVLGRGGMGIVYEAEHLALKRRVALKMILAGDQAGPKDLARFRIEAEAVARLQHPNIVQIHEVGEYDGCPFFSLEFVDGGSLAQKIKGKQLPWKQAAKLVHTLARAMHAAHERKIVHRDLKPANVLLTADGVPKIADFGLAKRLDADSKHTRTGVIMGTPSYMAPEQAGGKIRAINSTTDVYALGAILYETLTGRPPFEADTPMETVLQVLDREPVRPRQLRPRLSRDLETICLRCLQKDQESRYPSAEALADDLEAFLDGRPIRSRPVTAAERFWRWCRRNPVLSGLSGAAAVLVLFAAVMSATSYFRGKDVERLTGVTKEQEQIVTAQREKTEAQQEKIREEQGKVRTQEELTRSAGEARRAKEYVQDMQRARKAWEDLDFSQSRRLLELYMPRAGESDHRRWEWYYLRALLNETASVTILGQIPNAQSIRRIAWSPDDQYLACSFSAGGIKVWHAGMGDEVLSEEGPGSFANLTWSPNGTQLAAARYYRARAGSRDENRYALSVYDLPGKRKLRTFFDQKGGSRFNRDGIAWSADGHRLAAVAPDGERVAVWDVNTGRELFTFKRFALTNTQNRQTQVLQWSPDGQTIVAAGADGELHAWDAGTGREMFSLPGSGMTAEAVCWRPDSQELACLYRGGRAGLQPFVVQIWTMANRQVRLHLPGRPTDLMYSERDFPAMLTWSKDGQRLILSDDNDMVGSHQMPKVWDATTGKEIRLSESVRSGHRREALVDPSGRCCVDQTLWIRTVETDQVANSLNGLPQGSVRPLAWSCQGGRLALRGGPTVAWEGGKLMVWSLRPNARPRRPWVLDTLVWSPNSRITSGTRSVAGSMKSSAFRKG
jgi:WD40 repeat protein